MLAALWAREHLRKSELYMELWDLIPKWNRWWLPPKVAISNQILPQIKKILLRLIEGPFEMLVRLTTCKNRQVKNAIRNSTHRLWVKGIIEMIGNLPQLIKRRCLLRGLKMHRLHRMRIKLIWINKSNFNIVNMNPRACYMTNSLTGMQQISS